jgi:hypothetical protein
MRLGQPKTSVEKLAGKNESQSGRFVNLAADWTRRHLVLAILLVSLLAVAVNNYPILFCGKSYVSPMPAAAVVYDWWPPLPGMAQWPVQTAELKPSAHGSDIFSVMWWGVPLGFVESRSLLDHGELPLWNRYSHAGEPLIGQAISMLGDPLQLIVIFGRGSAWAWDIKYLAAKFLFCSGFGLLIFRLLAGRVLALIFSALAAYCGAFFYINNHPVFFVFSYAPWILLAAIEWMSWRSGRGIFWGLIWLLANFSCFNAGHVETAAVLIGGLNLAAMIYALAGCHNFPGAAKVLGRVAVGTVLFLGLTAPVWLTFMVSLQGALTEHERIHVLRLPPTALPGAFDDLFYLLFRPNEASAAFAPGTSLLILTGCAFTLSRWRQLKGETFFWVNSGAIVWWGGCIFGWVPSAFIAAIPFLNRVGHVETDFSYLLVMHLTIQCAYGFKGLTKIDKLGQVVLDFACAGGACTGIFLLYAIGYMHQPMPWNYFICVTTGAISAPLLFVFLKFRQRQALLLGWAGILVLGFIPNFRFGLYNQGNDDLLMLPCPRVVLNSPSAAVNQIKADKSAPFRVVGFPWGFMGNYSATYELEDIRSCSPLSDREFMAVMGQFPGIEINDFWVIAVVDPVKAHPLLNLLNVKYLLAHPGVDLGGKPGFRMAGQSDFAIIENQEAWPRAFFASRAVSIAAAGDFIQHLLTNGQQPFVALSPQTILDHPGLQLLVTTNPATITPATNYTLSPNATEFDVHAASAGIVCLTEGPATDFVATANHEPKEVLTVNRAFKGIYLDQPGDYHVKFSYRPRHWRLACACFWISLGAVVALALTGLIYSRRAAKMEAIS